MSETEFDSTDYGPKTIKGSSITEKGLSFVYKGIQREKGRFGTFYKVEVMVDGEEAELVFSSKGLGSLFEKHNEAFMDMEVIVCRYGKDEKTTYKVKLPQQTL